MDDGVVHSRDGDPLEVDVDSEAWSDTNRDRQATDDAHSPGERASEFSLSGPCGNATVATLDLDRRSLYFCVFDNHGEPFEAILEVGEAGAAPLVEDFGCGIDVFRALDPDPDSEPPSELVDACSEDARAARPLKLASAMQSLAYGSFCGSSGVSNFDEPCWETWHNYRYPNPLGFPDPNYCIDDGPSWTCYAQDFSTPRNIGYCQMGPYGSHQRTATVQIGTPPVRGREFVASCSGTTRFRGWYRYSGGGWINNLDFNISSGGYASWNYGEFNYDDLRFRGDSMGSAWHRYTGGFRYW